MQSIFKTSPVNNMIETQGFTTVMERRNGSYRLKVSYEVSGYRDINDEVKT